MEQWTSPDCGTTRISNPITLQRWIDLGWYQDVISEGYIFNPYCGRFRLEQCTCSACRNKRPNRNKLIQTLNQFKLKQ